MTKTYAAKDDKDISLEAIRGLAAITVVLYHCSLGFPLSEQAAYFWRGSPFYFFTNGPGAVSLFFVLSGYVLTRRYFLSGDNAILVKGAIKRWPRLLGPVLITVLISYVLFISGFYAFEEAGALSKSQWLIKFASAYIDPFRISLWGALKQGFFLVFFRGDCTYDSSLWTMRAEFIGSFVAFGMAPLLFEARKISLGIVVALASCVALLIHFAMPNLIAFPVGVSIAAILPRDKALPKWAACILILIAFYLMGYSGIAAGTYSIFHYLPSQDQYYMYPAIAGAAIIISLVETFPPLRRMLSGTISRWLGEFSFPIYLIHVLIICSLGSTVYLHYGRVPAIISVLVATPIAAFPLLVFNRKWVLAVNRLVTIIFQTRTDKETRSLAERISGQWFKRRSL